MADVTVATIDITSQSRYNVLYHDNGDGTYSPTSALVADSVTLVSSKSSTANTPAIVTSAGDALAANVNRKGWAIQNLGTNPLFVRLGTGASSTVFHRVLKGGSVNDDGLGGVIEDEGWLGVVSATGTSPRFVVMEMA